MLCPKQKSRFTIGQRRRTFAGDALFQSVHVVPFDERPKPKLSIERSDPETGKRGSYAAKQAEDMSHFVSQDKEETIELSLAEERAQVRDRTAIGRVLQCPFSPICVGAFSSSRGFQGKAGLVQLLIPNLRIPQCLTVGNPVVKGHCRDALRPLLRS